MLRMKRMKKNRLKEDMPETSSFRQRDNEEHDLAYYIHDRVELMHQVFSVIKTKDLKAMIPHCVKNISLNDLQELCTEELLGISSKRLCAVLDGAEAPSDTESSSSSPEQMETISLDSISSDEEILSHNSTKNRKHKHKKRKSKNKRRDSEKNKESSGDEKNRASRAGLTVLELLELQARARAIRAQLQKDQTLNKTPETVVTAAMIRSDDEVEIKEEPAEVVEISSEDEKPNVERLTAQLVGKSPDKTTEQECPKTITKRINDLVITVPQTKQTRKIKLNRNNVVSCEIPKNVTSTYVSPGSKKDNNQNSSANETVLAKDPIQSKKKSKKKEKNKQTTKKKDGSDHDEITLQLSDTEKMDLLEDLDRKNYDSVSSSSRNSGNSSDSDNSNTNSNNASRDNVPVHKEKEDKLQTMDITISTDENTIDTEKTETFETVNSNELIITDDDTFNCNDLKYSNDNSTNIDVMPNPDDDKPEEASQDTKDTDTNTKLTDEGSIPESVSKNTEYSTEHVDVNAKEHELNINRQRNISEREIIDRDSPAAETTNMSDIFSFSDEDKRKSKKEKKSKKKSKRCNDDKKDKEFETKKDSNTNISSVKDDDPNEIFELSDGSSCYEVEGVSVLSKEPTTVEIEALSAKVDDTIRENITDDVKEHEQVESEHSSAENISWKDRYLDSKKVKRVLRTSSILNAIRKKNKELKKKLEESRMITPVSEEKRQLEGTLDEYNTLEGSTKYVNPVSEKEECKEVKEVTKEMEKDAKQLLKMYKKLLKYNDINKKKDPNRKKGKKSKKKKQKHKEKEAAKAAANIDT